SREEVRPLHSFEEDTVSAQAKVTRRNMLLGSTALVAAPPIGSAVSPVRAQPARQQEEQDASNFERRFPTRKAAQRAHDDADYQRAVTAYRFWYPTVSCESFFHGLREAGIQDNQTISILSASPRQIIFTANSDTPYGSGVL